MVPYAHWVHDDFKTILLDSCDKYLQSSDHSTENTWTQLITHVSADITTAAQETNVTLPVDLEKVIQNMTNWIKTDVLNLVCALMVWQLYIGLL